MPGKLTDKVALITGGSSGMGLATAELFVEEGALVYITGRRQEPLYAATARVGPQLRGVVGDASNLGDIDRVFTTIRSESGRLDVLFASAGFANLGEPLTEVTPESFDQIFGLNVRGTVFTAQKAAVLMTSGGSIILNGSAAAEKAMPGSSVYAASKAALKAFARVWSAELALRGVRVNVLHPGPTDKERPQETCDYLVSLTTIGRLAQPSEIATAALFLASSDSSFVTGTELFVSGGMGQS